MGLRVGGELRAWVKVSGGEARGQHGLGLRRPMGGLPTGGRREDRSTAVPIEVSLLLRT